jgi:hypothetical protein
MLATYCRALSCHPPKYRAAVDTLDPLDDGEDHHRGGYAADRQQDLQQGSHGDAGVGAAADDVVGVVEDRVVEEEGRDREDEGSEEPGTHDPGCSLLRRCRRAQRLTGSSGDSAGGALRWLVIQLWTHIEVPSSGKVRAG